MTLPPWEKIVNVGFAIVVAMYLLMRMDMAITRLAEAMTAHEKSAAESRLLIIPLMREQITMLRTVCRHQARSETQLLECSQ